MPHQISEELFQNWQDVFASRIGRPQTPHAQIADYRALCRVFDSDADFHAAAQYVYERWQSWHAWPAPIEFESARAHLRRIPDAEVRATLKAIDASRRLAPPATQERDAVLEEFGDDWRTRLAHCAPDRLTADRRGPGGEDPWLTDERRAAMATLEREEASDDRD